MNDQESLLRILVKKGKPLAEVVVFPTDGTDTRELLKIFNALPEDIQAEVRPAYFQFDESNIVYQLRLDATKEALLREFGWQLEREKIYDSSEHNGEFPDGFCWNEVNDPQYFPDELKGKILEMGLTQPGSSDNGLNDLIEYEI